VLVDDISHGTDTKSGAYSLFTFQS